MPNFELKANKGEVARYLGYKGNIPDQKTSKLIDEMIALAVGLVRPKSTYEFFDLEPVKNGVKFVFADVCFYGKDVTAHLKNALKGIIFAATLGTETERQLHLLQKVDMEKAVIFDAVCDCLIEEYCDKCCEKIRLEQLEKGLFINTRFSPGYGDLSIEVQKDIIKILNCEKRIGLSVTSSFVLLPRKSVSALIGVFKEKPTPKAGSCERCSLQNVCKMKGSSECLNQTDFI